MSSLTPLTVRGKSPFVKLDPFDCSRSEFRRSRYGSSTRRLATVGAILDAIAEALDAFLHQQEKPRTVTRIEEDVLAAITAKNDVVNSAGIMKSWFTWHG